LIILLIVATVASVILGTLLSLAVTHMYPDIDPAGAPITLVSATLGHADLKTTSVYAHARPGESSGRYLKTKF
jgi:hypothetical protein